MTKAGTANLVKVKTALAEKYARLAKGAGSKPKKKRYLYHAEHYRQQAKNLSRL